MNETDDGYEGTVTLLVAGSRYELTARLGGYFQPLDGHYRWYGRLEPNDELTRLIGGGTREVTLLTPDGEVSARIADPDVWGRYRIEGSGMPPFRVPVSLEDVGIF
jgi:hypothetical protein